MFLGGLELPVLMHLLLAGLRMQSIFESLNASSAGQEYKALHFELVRTSLPELCPRVARLASCRFHSCFRDHRFMLKSAFGFEPTLRGHGLESQLLAAVTSGPLLEVDACYISSSVTYACSRCLLCRP